MFNIRRRNEGRCSNLEYAAKMQGTWRHKPHSFFSFRIYVTMIQSNFLKHAMSYLWLPLNTMYTFSFFLDK